MSSQLSFDSIRERISSGQRRRSLNEDEMIRSELMSKLKSVSKLFRLLLVGFLTHVRMFYMTLDPIKTVDSVEDIPLVELLDHDSFRPNLFTRLRNNEHFLLPFVMMLVTNVDSVLVLHREGFVYNVTGLPDLLTHRIYPPELYLEGDVVCNLGIVVEMFVYGFLLFSAPLDPRYCMYAVYNSRQKQWKIVFNGKIWDAENTNKILRYREKARKVFSVIMLCVLIQLYVYWTGSLAMKPTTNPKDVVIFALLPFFALYSSFGVIYMPFYFILCAHYTRIKQQLVVGKIKKFANKMIGEDNLNEGTVNTRSLEMYWRRFVSINREVLALFDELHAYNAFWSKYVTCYFMGYIAMMGYLAYGFLFADTEFDLQKTSFFSFFTIETLTTMLVISYECSCIVYYNVQIYKTNRTFCYAFGRVAPTRYVYLLKMSKIISNYRGTRNGFRLINNYIIDSKMFEILFFYISTLFMMVFRNKMKFEEIAS